MEESPEDAINRGTKSVLPIHTRREPYFMEFAAISVFAWIFGVVLFVVWLFVPFAIMGINKKMEINNQRLREIIAILEEKNGPVPKDWGNKR